MNKLQTIERYRKLDSATIFGGIRAVLIAKTKNEYNAASGYEKTFMRGVNNQTMGKMLVGFARTLRMVPPRLDIINEKPAGENSPEFEAMSSCTEENVLVIDAMRFHHASVGGDVKFLNLYMNKAEGVVTDGSIRDLNEVKKYNFKIFSAGRTGSIGIPDVWPYEANVTISCGEAVVKPDDLIVGDDDGVVVVPNFIINEVLMWCEKHQNDEKIIKDLALKENVSPGKYYNPEFFKKLNQQEKSNDI